VGVSVGVGVGVCVGGWVDTFYAPQSATCIAPNQVDADI